MTVIRKNRIRPAGASDVIVIGAGHSGLATSHCLGESGVDHVVLERGEVANSWRTERWDSLKLLTPNWQSRLPGFRYAGDDPDGFMSMSEVVDFIDAYRTFTGAPVRTHTPVHSVRREGDGYRVATASGDWVARAVVMASGAFNVANRPAVADAVPAGIASLTPHEYRNPAQLEDGGVLIVGASATGLQLAHEIQAAGHDVTIAVGEHVRMPRTYRGRDIQFWLDRTGILDERYDEVDDVRRARGLPSPQLIGSKSLPMLDLNELTDGGARIVGRLMGIRDGIAQFSGSLGNICTLADLKMNRLLEAIDEWAEEKIRRAEIPAAERFPATRVPQNPVLTLPLGDGSIRTIIWATGFRPDYSWLDVPVFDARGNLRHDGGITASPGLYVTGLPMLRRRKSSFMHGAEDDVRDLTAHLSLYLDGQMRPRMSA